MEWFYEGVRTLLARPGMSQQKCAELIGASQSAVSNYARGEGGPNGPSLKIAMRVLEEIGGDFGRALPGGTLNDSERGQMNVLLHELARQVQGRREDRAAIHAAVAILAATLNSPLDGPGAVSQAG